ncbi:hypothetical protein PR048_025532 [Dryococelus australis]|uniref:Uncharacterized protein n=1 Tax=Dryococelus australis TaxID=614101 RepID=A0ABQ9GRJ8_9NEOP|nr:hypothetical protein PR048_025532 [Dryococelus australis]
MEVDQLQNKRSSALNTDDHTNPATKESKFNIEYKTGSEDEHEESIDENEHEDSDSAEDDDYDLLDALTHLSNTFAATSDMKKAEDSENTGFLISEDPNNLRRNWGRIERESVIAFVRDLSQHSPGVISENHGGPKSGWPDGESNPGPPECESSVLPHRHLAWSARISPHSYETVSIARHSLPHRIASHRIAALWYQYKDEVEAHYRARFAYLSNESLTVEARQRPSRQALCQTVVRAGNSNNEMRSGADPSTVRPQVGQPRASALFRSLLGSVGATSVTSRARGYSETTALMVVPLWPTIVQNTVARMPIPSWEQLACADNCLHSPWLPTLNSDCWFGIFDLCHTDEEDRHTPNLRFVTSLPLSTEEHLEPRTANQRNPQHHFVSMYLHTLWSWRTSTRGRRSRPPGQLISLEEGEGAPHARPLIYSAIPGLNFFLPPCCDNKYGPHLAAPGSSSSLAHLAPRMSPQHQASTKPPSAFRRLRETGSVQVKRANTGARRRVRAPSYEEDVLEKAVDQPSTSTRAIVNTLGISNLSVRAVLHEQQLHTYRPPKVQTMGFGLRQRRPLAARARDTRAPSLNCTHRCQAVCVDVVSPEVQLGVEWTCVHLQTSALDQTDRNGITAAKRADMVFVCGQANRNSCITTCTEGRNVNEIDPEMFLFFARAVTIYNDGHWITVMWKSPPTPYTVNIAKLVPRVANGPRVADLPRVVAIDASHHEPMNMGEAGIPSDLVNTRRRPIRGVVTDLPHDSRHLTMDRKRAFRGRRYQDFCKQPSASLTR